MYVKDYDGGTHMECYVHPTVPYMAQTDMFKKQREFLLERIADVSHSTRVYPGLPASSFVDGSLKHHIDIPGESDTCSKLFKKPQEVDNLSVELCCTNFDVGKV